MVLSKERVGNVKKSQVTKGIQPGRIVTVGLGETLPVTLNLKKEGKVLTRRAEVHILSSSNKIR